MHELFVAADCSQNIIRVLYVGFSKAFDVIHHNVLLNKFTSNNIPEHIIVWSLNFLNGRKQLVKIGNSVSNTTAVTPQGTVSRPNDFRLVINNLTANTCYAQPNMSIMPLFFLSLHFKLLQIISSIQFNSIQFIYQ